MIIIIIFIIWVIYYYKIYNNDPNMKGYFSEKKSVV